MKQFMKRRWVVPVATLVLTLSIGSAAFAATGSFSTDPSAVDTSTAVTSTDATASASEPDGASTTKPWDDQRGDETLLTGDTLAKVQEAALAEVGSDATVVRAETDADGNAAYEAHVQKSDGTRVTVYIDESFNVVSVQDQPAGGHRGGPGPGPSSTSTDSTSTTSN